VKQPRSHIRLFGALALLSALSLGSAAHIWHHLIDPDCDPAGTHRAQPCATCVSLHSLAIASEPEQYAPPDPILIPETSPAEADHHVVPVLSEGTPRAPPAA